MADEPSLNHETVRALSTAAELQLTSARATLLAPQLDLWIRGANELSRKMSAPEHWLLSPVTSFTHRVHR